MEDIRQTDGISLSLIDRNGVGHPLPYAFDDLNPTFKWELPAGMAQSAYVLEMRTRYPVLYSDGTTYRCAYMTSGLVRSASNRHRFGTAIAASVWPGTVELRLRIYGPDMSDGPVWCTHAASSAIYDFEGDRPSGLMWGSTDSRLYACFDPDINSYDNVFGMRFRFRKSEDEDAGQALSYELQVSRSPLFDEAGEDCVTVEGLSVSGIYGQAIAEFQRSYAKESMVDESIGSLYPNEMYFFRARSFDGLDWSDWSVVNAAVVVNNDVPVCRIISVEPAAAQTQLGEMIITCIVDDRNDAAVSAGLMFAMPMSAQEGIAMGVTPLPASSEEGLSLATLRPADETVSVSYLITCALENPTFLLSTNTEHRLIWHSALQIRDDRDGVYLFMVANDGRSEAVFAKYGPFRVENLRNVGSSMAEQKEHFWLRGRCDRVRHWPMLPEDCLRAVIDGEVRSDSSSSGLGYASAGLGTGGKGSKSLVSRWMELISKWEDGAGLAGFNRVTLKEGGDSGAAGSIVKTGSGYGIVRNKKYDVSGDQESSSFSPTYVEPIDGYSGGFVALCPECSSTSLLATWPGPEYSEDDTGRPVRTFPDGSVKRWLRCGKCGRLYPFSWIWQPDLKAEISPFKYGRLPHYLYKGYNFRKAKDQDTEPFLSMYSEAEFESMRKDFKERTGEEYPHEIAYYGKRPSGGSVGGAGKESAFGISPPDLPMKMDPRPDVGTVHMVRLPNTAPFSMARYIDGARLNGEVDKDYLYGYMPVPRDEDDPDSVDDPGDKALEVLAKSFPWSNPFKMWHIYSDGKNPVPYMHSYETTVRDRSDAGDSLPEPVTEVIVICPYERNSRDVVLREMGQWESGGAWFWTKALIMRMSVRFTVQWPVRVVRGDNDRFEAVLDGASASGSVLQDGQDSVRLSDQSSEAQRTALMAMLERIYGRAFSFNDAEVSDDLANSRTTVVLRGRDDDAGVSIRSFELRDCGSSCHGTLGLPLERTFQNSIVADGHEMAIFHGTLSESLKGTIMKEFEGSTRGGDASRVTGRNTAEPRRLEDANGVKNPVPAPVVKALGGMEYWCLSRRSHPSWYAVEESPIDNSIETGFANLRMGNLKKEYGEYSENGSARASFRKVPEDGRANGEPLFTCWPDEVDENGYHFRYTEDGFRETGRIYVRKRRTVPCNPFPRPGYGPGGSAGYRDWMVEPIPGKPGRYRKVRTAFFRGMNAVPRKILAYGGYGEPDVVEETGWFDGEGDGAACISHHEPSDSGAGNSPAAGDFAQGNVNPDTYGEQGGPGNSGEGSDSTIVYIRNGIEWRNRTLQKTCVVFDYVDITEALCKNPFDRDHGVPPLNHRLPFGGIHMGMSTDLAYDYYGLYAMGPYGLSADQRTAGKTPEELVRTAWAKDYGARLGLDGAGLLDRLRSMAKSGTYPRAFTWTELGVDRANNIVEVERSRYEEFAAPESSGQTPGAGFMAAENTVPGSDSAWEVPGRGAEQYVTYDWKEEPGSKRFQGEAERNALDRYSKVWGGRIPAQSGRLLGQITVEQWNPGMHMEARNAFKIGYEPERRNRDYFKVDSGALRDGKRLPAAGSLVHAKTFERWGDARVSSRMQGLWQLISDRSFRQDGEWTRRAPWLDFPAKESYLTGFARYFSGMPVDEHPSYADRPEPSYRWDRPWRVGGWMRHGSTLSQYEDREGMYYMESMMDYGYFGVVYVPVSWNTYLMVHWTGVPENSGTMLSIVAQELNDAGQSVGEPFSVRTASGEWNGDLTDGATQGFWIIKAKGGYDTLDTAVSGLKYTADGNAHRYFFTMVQFDYAGNVQRQSSDGAVRFTVSEAARSPATFTDVDYDPWTGVLKVRFRIDDARGIDYDVVGFHYTVAEPDLSAPLTIADPDGLYRSDTREWDSSPVWRRLPLTSLTGELYGLASNQRGDRTDAGMVVTHVLSVNVSEMGITSSDTLRVNVTVAPAAERDGITLPVFNVRMWANERLKAAEDAYRKIMGYDSHWTYSTGIEEAEDGSAEPVSRWVYSERPVRVAGDLQEVRWRMEEIDGEFEEWAAKIMKFRMADVECVEQWLRSRPEWESVYLDGLAWEAFMAVGRMREDYASYLEGAGEAAAMAEISGAGPDGLPRAYWRKRWLKARSYSGYYAALFRENRDEAVLAGLDRIGASGSGRTDLDESGSGPASIYHTALLGIASDRSDDLANFYSYGTELDPALGASAWESDSSGGRTRDFTDAELLYYIQAKSLEDSLMSSHGNAQLFADTAFEERAVIMRDSYAVPSDWIAPAFVEADGYVRMAHDPDSALGPAFGGASSEWFQAWLDGRPQEARDGRGRWLAWLEGIGWTQDLSDSMSAGLPAGSSSGSSSGRVRWLAPSDLYRMFLESEGVSVQDRGRQAARRNFMGMQSAGGVTYSTRYSSYQSDAVRLAAEAEAARLEKAALETDFRARLVRQGYFCNGFEGNAPFRADGSAGAAFRWRVETQRYEGDIQSYATSYSESGPGYKIVGTDYGYDERFEAYLLFQMDHDASFASQGGLPLREVEFLYGREKTDANRILMGIADVSGNVMSHAEGVYGQAGYSSEKDPVYDPTMFQYGASIALADAQLPGEQDGDVLPDGMDPGLGMNTRWRGAYLWRVAPYNLLDRPVVEAPCGEFVSIGFMDAVFSCNDYSEGARYHDWVEFGAGRSGMRLAVAEFDSRFPAGCYQTVETADMQVRNSQDSPEPVVYLATGTLQIKRWQCDDRSASYGRYENGAEVRDWVPPAHYAWADLGAISRGEVQFLTDRPRFAEYPSDSGSISESISGSGSGTGPAPAPQVSFIEDRIGNFSAEWVPWSTERLRPWAVMLEDGRRVLLSDKSTGTRTGPDGEYDRRLVTVSRGFAADVLGEESVAFIGDAFSGLGTVMAAGGGKLPALSLFNACAVRTDVAHDLDSSGMRRVSGRESYAVYFNALVQDGDSVRTVIARCDTEDFVSWGEMREVPVTVGGEPAHDLLEPCVIRMAAERPGSDSGALELRHEMYATRKFRNYGIDQSEIVRCVGDGESFALAEAVPVSAMSKNFSGPCAVRESGNRWKLYMSYDPRGAIVSAGLSMGAGDLLSGSLGEWDSAPADPGTFAGGYYGHPQYTNLWYEMGNEGSAKDDGRPADRWMLRLDGYVNGAGWNEYYDYPDDGGWHDVSVTVVHTEESGLPDRTYRAKWDGLYGGALHDNSSIVTVENGMLAGSDSLSGNQVTWWMLMGTMENDGPRASVKSIRVSYKKSETWEEEMEYDDGGQTWTWTEERYFREMSDSASPDCLRYYDKYGNFGRQKDGDGNWETSPSANFHAGGPLILNSGYAGLVFPENYGYSRPCVVEDVVHGCRVRRIYCNRQDHPRMWTAGESGPVIREIPEISETLVVTRYLEEYEWSSETMRQWRSDENDPSFLPERSNYSTARVLEMRNGGWSPVLRYADNGKWTGLQCPASPDGARIRLLWPTAQKTILAARFRLDAANATVRCMARGEWLGRSNVSSTEAVLHPELPVLDGHDYAADESPALYYLEESGLMGDFESWLAENHLENSEEAAERYLKETGAWTRYCWSTRRGPGVWRYIGQILKDYEWSGKRG